MRAIKISVLFVCLCALCLVNACGDDDQELSCLTELNNVDIMHQTDEFIVTFEISYSGNLSVDPEVQWAFGDGTEVTATGTTVEHTYSALGTYDAVAIVTLRDNDATCQVPQDEQVVIN